jgi:hypothetical protein
VHSRLSELCCTPGNIFADGAGQNHTLLGELEKSCWRLKKLVDQEAILDKYWTTSDGFRLEGSGVRHCGQTARADHLAVFYSTLLI